MTLRCLFGHRTRLTASGDEGQIRCQRCGHVVESWPLVRPEQAILRARAEARVKADRERRAAQMTTPVRLKVLRMR